MFEQLDRKISLKVVIWFFPLAFLIHDFEEILTMPRFWRENKDSLPIPEPLKKRIRITTSEVSVGVFYEFLITCLAAYPAAQSLRPGRAVRFFTAAVSALFLNVFTHLGQTLLLRKYTPGVVTAPLVPLPYALYTFHRLFQAKLIDRRSFARSMLGGALLAVPLVLSAHLIGHLFSRS